MLIVPIFEKDGKISTKPPTKFALTPVEGGHYALAELSDFPALSRTLVFWNAKDAEYDIFTLYKNYLDKHRKLLDDCTQPDPDFKNLNEKSKKISDQESRLLTF